MKTGMILIVFATLSYAAACNKDGTKADVKQAARATPPTAAAPSASRLEIQVTEKGFEPDDVQVPAGKPVTLVFTRKTDDTCAKEVVVNLPDGKQIEKSLPLDQPVEIAATFPSVGTLGYACGMNMMKGTITVQ